MYLEQKVHDLTEEVRSLKAQVRLLDTSLSRSCWQPEVTKSMSAVDSAVTYGNAVRSLEVLRTEVAHLRNRNNFLSSKTAELTNLRTSFDAHAVIRSELAENLSIVCRISDEYKIQAQKNTYALEAYKQTLKKIADLVFRAVEIAGLSRLLPSRDPTPSSCPIGDEYGLLNAVAILVSLVEITYSKQMYMRRVPTRAWTDI